MGDAGLPAPVRLGGIVTVPELIAAGVSRTRIRILVRQGVLTPVCRGVYARPAAVQRGPRDDHALGLAAALAVSGPEAAGSHHSAALIHGLDLLGGVPAGIATLTRPPEAKGSRTGRPGIRLHTVALPARHVVAAPGGVRVTSVARTVVDLARGSSLRAGVVTADSALRLGLTTPAELQRAIADCARWPGITRARQVAAFSDGRSESALESLARVVFHEQGLPPPELQVWVGGDDFPVGRVDFLWRRFRTVGEADGALKYGRPAAARAQLQRDAQLREAGFEVVHFTWGQIARVPYQVAAALLAAFEHGRQQGVRAG